ncbi:threonine-phosphate decarboxylase CobD [Ruminiclostridium cellobioparum]|uniref:threonine-phosphate decarboxylase n=1 Tax=Ruminiclostridium cellobioparum subsp. termitidis CT1112 TaxID=1195236 RepID=S0FRZ8_RUMCE|nr:threonine-phosphate decarboxylase CobD [Ruminiclostridium cellobioparum]EMS73121.1 Histidinol-phosphate/aromatic aminotransferase and cobyric acid decarboxylase [Ruminiclostridium cellobioparum subsp. termitidis CT1112]
MSRQIHGGDIYSYGKIAGNIRLIDFSANINPLGLPEGVKNAVIENLDDFSNYPDPLCRELVKEIALHENVPESYILCGSGAADIIYRIAEAVRPGITVVTAPTFSEYEEAVRAAGSNIKYYYLHKGNGFNAGKDILDEVGPGIDLMFLCNPNNPTGNLTDKKLVLALAEKCRENKTILAVDECFIDFLENAGEFSIVDCLHAYDNVIVLKAFTKIYAMAGIRLGYAMCSDKDIIQRLGRAGQPWSVSSVAQLCGTAALKETDYIHRTKKLIKENREKLTLELRSLGFEVFASCANFILFRTENKALSRELLKYGILIRSCDNFVGLDNSFFRIAVKSKEDNEYLVESLKKLTPKG